MYQVLLLLLRMKYFSDSNPQVLAHHKLFRMSPINIQSVFLNIDNKIIAKPVEAVNGKINDNLRRR